MTDLGLDLENSVISGELFNELFGYNKFVKYASYEYDLGKFTQENGVYYCSKEFTNTNYSNYSNSTSTQYIYGGIEFYSDREQFFKKLKTYYVYDSNIYNVEVPNDADVHIKKDCFAATKLILTNKRKLVDMDEWNDLEYCKLAAEFGCEKYIKVKSDEIMLKMIENDWFLIKDVAVQTDEMCEIALKKQPYAFIHIKNPSQKICNLAVSLSSDNIKYVPSDKKTYEVYLAAVRNKPEILKEIPFIFKTEELLTAAVKKNGYFITYIEDNFLTEELGIATILGLATDVLVEKILLHIKPHNITSNLCDTLVTKFGTSIQHIPSQFITEELCVKAINQNPNVINLIDKSYLTNNLYLKVLSKNGLLLKNITNQTDEMCYTAVENNGLALEFAQFKTPEICQIAYQNDISAIKFIPEPSMQMCNDAIKKDITLITHTSSHYNPSNEDLINLIKKNPKYLFDINNPTEDMVLEAVKQDCNIIRKINKEYLSYNIYLEAVKQNSFLLEIVPIELQSIEMCIMAIKHRPFSIQQIKNLNEEICLEAVKANCNTFYNMPRKFKTALVCIEAVRSNSTLITHILRDIHILDIPIELQEEAVKVNGNFLKYIDNPSSNVIKLAVLNNPMAIEYLEESQQTDEICNIAIGENPLLINRIKNQTVERCLAAINKNYLAFNGIKEVDELFCIYACI